jgi:hypothetical protein
MRLALTLSAFLLLGSASAFADDWTVVRVRGGVFALDNGQWVQLLRDSVVSDDRIIKSAPGGRATFVRGAETIEVGSDTTIQIDDSKRGFTTIYEHAGTVGVDAEARNVQHFAVQTPFVAAVVKGTAFVVETGQTASFVAVSRGTVAVHDEHFGTDVAVHAGSAVASGDEPVTMASVTAIPAGTVQPPAPAAQQPVIAESVPVSRPDVDNNRVKGHSDGGGAVSKNDRPDTSEHGHGHGNSDSENAGHGNSGNSGNHGSGNSDNGNGNSSGGHGNGGSNSGNGNENSGGHGNGNSGNSNGNSGNGNSGDNGNSGGGHGNGGDDGNSGGSNENGNSGKGSDNSGNGNSGGNGKGGK